MNLNQKLTDNFTLLELVNTSHKEFLQNNVDYALDNLRQVFDLALFCQRLRDFLGLPIQITSGIRCPALNAKVGGAKTSEHLLIKAVDIVVKGLTAEKIFDLISFSNLTYGQMILERANGKEWVHISVGTKKERLLYDGKQYIKI